MNHPANMLIGIAMKAISPTRYLPTLVIPNNRYLPHLDLNWGKINHVFFVTLCQNSYIQ